MNTDSAAERRQQGMLSLVESRHAFWAKLKAAILEAGLTLENEMVKSDTTFANVKSAQAPEWEMPIRVERNGYKAYKNRLAIGRYRHIERFTKLDDARVAQTVTDLLASAKYAADYAKRAAVERDERAKWKERMIEQMEGAAQIPGIEVKIKDSGPDAGMYSIEIDKDSPLRRLDDEQVKAFLHFIEHNFSIHPYRVGKRVRLKGHVRNSASEFEDGVIIDASMDRIHVRIDAENTVYAEVSSSTITLLD